LKIPKSTTVLVVIIIAQFFGTSLWFAGNAVLPQLQLTFGWPQSSLGYITSSTQIGFIIGTLVFAVTGITDQFSPSRVFLWSCVAASAGNLLSLTNLSSLEIVVLSRLLTGFFLAGIYPVGMKIASDWKADGLGYWLGALVGALVLGTAFPHSLRLIPSLINNSSLLLTTVSVLAIAGGILVAAIIPDGPFRKRGASFSISSLKTIFKIPAFRSASFGYFGHMWELYAFWAFVPFIVSTYVQSHSIETNIAWISFVVIASGAVGCFIGGILSNRFGSSLIATGSLFISFLCCIFSPFIWDLNFEMFLAVMMVWGIAVVADSPQFSALVAKHAPSEAKGSAITIVICIGFAITIITIQGLAYLQSMLENKYLLLPLAIGPAIGLMSMKSSFIQK
jgi:MFS family permease